MFCCVRRAESPPALPSSVLDFSSALAEAIRTDNIDWFKHLTTGLSSNQIASIQIKQCFRSCTLIHPIFYYACSTYHKKADIAQHLLDLFEKICPEELIKTSICIEHSKQTKHSPLFVLLDKAPHLHAARRLIDSLSLQHLLTSEHLASPEHVTVQYCESSYRSNTAVSLLNRRIHTLLLAIGLVQAHTANEPTPLQRFQRSSLYEPRLIRLVGTFLEKSIQSQVK
jgi:hypothetical protein